MVAPQAGQAYISMRPVPPAASCCVGWPMPAAAVSLHPQRSHAGLSTCAHTHTRIRADTSYQYERNGLPAFPRGKDALFQCLRQCRAEYESMQH